jgi:hypothetical protein
MDKLNLDDIYGWMQFAPDVDPLTPGKIYKMNDSFQIIVNNMKQYDLSLGKDSVVWGHIQKGWGILLYKKKS